MEKMINGKGQNLKYERVNQRNAMETGRRINLKIIQKKYQEMITRLLAKTGRETILTRDENEKLN